jgi:hypothetical protein
MWIGFIWLKIGTGGGLLWTRWWTFGFHKMWGIPWLAVRTLSFSIRTLLHGVSLVSYIISQKLVIFQFVETDNFRTEANIWMVQKTVSVCH